MAIKNSAPCKTCEMRYAGCHRICLHYDVWRWELNQKQRELYGIQRRERMLNDFYADSVTKSIKKSGGRV